MRINNYTLEAFGEMEVKEREAAIERSEERKKEQAEAAERLRIAQEESERLRKDFFGKLDALSQFTAMGKTHPHLDQESVQCTTDWIQPYEKIDAPDGYDLKIRYWESVNVIHRPQTKSTSPGNSRSCGFELQWTRTYNINGETIVDTYTEGEDGEGEGDGVVINRNLNTIDFALDGTNVGIPIDDSVYSHNIIKDIERTFINPILDHYQGKRPNPLSSVLVDR